MAVPVSYSFAVDASGNILAVVSGAKFFKAGNKNGIDVNIGGNSIDYGYTPVALNGKIYLLKEESKEVKAFAVDQNGTVNAQEIASVPVSGNSPSLRIYYVGASTVFAKVGNRTTQHVLRFDGSELKNVSFPSGKKVFQNSDGRAFSFEQGQQAFYALFASSTDTKKGTNVYRSGATTFEPILPASEANKLENIYQFAVLPGSPDKIAVAAKTKTETKDGKTTGGKYVIIELDANSKKVLRRSP